MIEIVVNPTACPTCQHFACVCAIRVEHPDPTCKFRIAATGSIAIECDHGYDVCPECDPCTCSRPLVGYLLVADLEVIPVGGDCFIARGSSWDTQIIAIEPRAQQRIWWHRT